MKEGFREGKKEGELVAATTIATALKKEGLSTTQIAKYTNLSIEEIEKL